MIETGTLIFIFLALCGAGLILSLMLPEHRIPQMLAWVGSLASLSMVWASADALLSGVVVHVKLWTIPPLGTLSLRMDRLSALFLLVAGLVFLATSIYSAGYLQRYLRCYSLKAFSIWYMGLFVSIVLVLIAGDVFSLLLAWEGMSILSYLLVNFEHEREDHIQAGYLMLAMGEGGTLAVALGLLLLANAAGSLEFSTIKTAAAGLTTGVRWAVFLLSFFGFGVKAGLLPFNLWLPRAHPVAPGNVSALLSGVILNLGIYGIVRVNIDLLPVTVTGPGLIALVVGTVSALVGILYATTENDLKTMLAHSSIENAGIIAAGLGAGFVFTASGHPALAGVAFIAALYHMGNHSLYKALLFLGAGTIDTNVGTRDMDRLGGLIRRMPWTALFFLVGALSIAALPPFNGFVSEWLTLQTLLRSVELSSAGAKIVFALCGAGLALTAALAVTCFVKAFAMGFLGMARSSEAEQAVEARRSMTAPMGILAALCLFLGVLPTYAIPVLDQTLAPLTGTSAVDALIPPFFSTSPDHPQLPSEFAAEFHDLGAQVGENLLPGRGLVVLHRGGVRNPVVFAMSTSYMLVVLLMLLGLSYGAVRGLTRARAVARRVCWDGGVRRLLPEMTYTATGFSNPLRVIFEAVFRPTTVEDTKEMVAEHFRAAICRPREEVHVLERILFRPLVSGVVWTANLCAKMHHGKLNAYAVYVLLTLLGVLVIAWFQ